MPTRLTPYVFGMWAAHIYHFSENINYQTSTNVVYEWVCLILILAICFIGVSPHQYASWAPVPHFIYMTTCRQIFGAAVAYLIHMMLTPKPETPIDWYRPSCFLRWILSKQFWVPIATISYSFYVFHIAVIDWT